MTVTLPKGGNMLLTDEAPGIACVRVGLGWSVKPGSGGLEIDGLIGVGGPADVPGHTDVSGATPARFVLTHQVPNPDESLGAAPGPSAVVGDVEKAVVTLAAVPGDIQRLLFGAAIYDAAGRRQSFRSVTAAYIRLVNDDNGVEIARFTLDAAEGRETAMIFGELYRHPRGWKFRAVGQGYERGLRGVAEGTAGRAGATELLSAPPTQLSGYLRRSSPARSRRNLAEHLDPPRPAAAPPKPAPAPAPKPAHPARPGLRAPSRPTPPAAPPPPPKPAPAPAARSSLLDLSSPAEPPSTQPARPARLTHPGRPAPQPTPAPAAPVTYSEHSSRHRQQQESVSVLDADHPATTWTESDRGSGRLVITLRWEPLKTARGLPRPSDVYVGALWEAGDLPGNAHRATGLLQTVGGASRAPGTAGPRQVLALNRRDEVEGHAIFADLAALPTFRRFFVYVYGQHGAPEWGLLRPSLTVQAPSGQTLAIRPGDVPSGARLDVLASFHVVAGDLIIRREDAYTEATLSDAAARFGWELDWAPDGMGLRTSER